MNEPTLASDVDQELERAVELLNRLLSHKSDSLFRYALNAAPYVAPGDEQLLQRICRIAQTHDEQAAELARVIHNMDGVAQPLGHDIGIADLNYLSLRYLLNPLIEYQEHCVEEAEGDLPKLAPYAEATSAVERIIETDRRDMENLKALKG